MHIYLCIKINKLEFSNKLEKLKIRREYQMFSVRGVVESTRVLHTVEYSAIIKNA